MLLPNIGVGSERREGGSKIPLWRWLLREATCSYSRGNNETKMGREGKAKLAFVSPPSPGHDGLPHPSVWVLGFGVFLVLEKELRFVSLNFSMDVKEVLNSGSDHSQKPIKCLQSVSIILCGWFVLQIQEFSSGFWTGSQLACWDRTEKPWSLFPKLSIYMRDENSSRSFRISILPQVSTFFVYSSVHLFLLL